MPLTRLVRKGRRCEEGIEKKEKPERGEKGRETDHKMVDCVRPLKCSCRRRVTRSPTVLSLGLNV